MWKFPVETKNKCVQNSVVTHTQNVLKHIRQEDAVTHVTLSINISEEPTTSYLISWGNNSAHPPICIPHQNLVHMYQTAWHHIPEGN
jgi:hypothetical protein